MHLPAAVVLDELTDPFMVIWWGLKPINTWWCQPAKMGWSSKIDAWSLGWWLQNLVLKKKQHHKVCIIMIHRLHRWYDCVQPIHDWFLVLSYMGIWSDGPIGDWGDWSCRLILQLQLTRLARKPGRPLRWRAISTSLPSGKHITNYGKSWNITIFFMGQSTVNGHFP